MNTGKREQTDKALTGKKGEDAAVAFLVNQGWRLLERNWRYIHLELDAVFYDKETLVFVEVKTRKAGSMQSPSEALNKEKKSRLFRAAQAWLCMKDEWGKPCRFDLVSVTVENGIYKAELIKNVIKFEEFGNTQDSSYSSWQPW